MYRDLTTVGNINVENDGIGEQRVEAENRTVSIRRNDQAGANSSHSSDIYIRARAIYFRARRNNGSRAASII